METLRDLYKSSVLYLTHIDVRKNYKIKYKQEHQHAVDQLPATVFTWKADYAESTSTHNTGNANYVHTLYGDIKTPPQELDEKIRTTIYGYPALIFHRPDTASNLEFIGKFNYNYDKSATNVYGFTDEYPLAQSWEFLNNTSNPCLFHGEITEDWTDDFEARHPDEHDDISVFKVMHDWVVSTYQEAATNTPLPQPYIGIDGTSYTNDTAEYRLAKFRKEFEEHFDLDFSLLYYIYTFVMLMVDQRAKNMFLTTWDGVIFQPWFYDNDTCLGINNEGVLVFDYYHEDHDQLGTANVYNGATSTLWVNFRECFKDEIKEFYQALRSSGALSYEKIIEYFITRQSDKWPISVYNEDSDFKYISMLRSDGDATNLYQVRGTGEEHLRYFISNRLMYLDSKWYGADYADDYASLRIYTPSGNLAVTPNADITVTPYSDIYAGVMYRANGTLQQKRATKNTPITFNAPNETFNDTETAVYGASEIASLGDLSPLYCGTVNVSKARKLTELIIGSDIEGYSNPNLHEVAVGANKLLKKINICNCPSYTSALQLANCPNIQEIYATGSGITGLELPPSGYLKQVHLPATLTNLTITNQQYIEDFTLEGYNALTTLRIEKTANVPVEDIMLNAPNLNRIRLLDVEWNAESEDALLRTITKFESCIGIDASNGNVDKAIVTGKVTVPSISNELYNRIYNSFPDLVVDDGTGDIYIINFVDRNKNSIYIERLSEGEDVVDPITTGQIERPEDIIEDNVRYIFAGWSTLPTNVNTHYQITPVYRTQYPVRYYNDDGTSLLYTQWVYEGEDAFDPIATGDCDIPTKSSSTTDMFYIFNCWDNIPKRVTAPIAVRATYNVGWGVRFFNDGVEVDMQIVRDGSGAVDPITRSENPIDEPTRPSIPQYDYTYAGWDKDFSNITAPLSVNATYSQIIRSYNVNFYNMDELLYVSENIIYGSSTTYVGSPPVKKGVSDPENYIFTGWYPKPENITGETNCYALFRYNAFTTDSWATINENVNNGTAISKYPVGTRKELVITLSDGIEYAIDLEVVAHNHDNLANGSGKATLTFMCKYLPGFTSSFKTDGNNTNGWQGSDLRIFTNGELFNAFPNDLKNAIKPVLKIADGGILNKALVTTTDSCWVPSYDEVGLELNRTDNIPGQGERYADTFEYGYSGNSTRVRYTSDGYTAGRWWLRTSSYNEINPNNALALRIQTNGSVYQDILYYKFYVMFGFCI